MLRIVVWMLPAMGLMALLACESSAERYAEEISALDSALVAVDSAAVVFGTISVEEVKAAFATMNKDLKEAQYMLEAEDVDIETARLFAEYTRARRLIKDFPQRMRTLPAELERTQLQLIGLKNALQGGATVDAMGNKITPEYVKKQHELELNLARGLCEELLNTADYAERSLVIYAETEPQVREQLIEWKQK